MKEMRSGLALLLALALPAGAGAPTITVYEHIGFGGKSTTITGAVPRLDAAWNDQASSLEIDGGAWELCRHYDYVDCRVFDADSTDLRAIGWNDAVSSLRPVVIAPPPRRDPPSSAPAAPAAARASTKKAADFAGQPAAVKGYLDYRKDDALVVEGQRLVVTPSTKFHGAGEARSPASIPLGYQVEGSGVRRADGAIALARLDAKPNGQQMFESDVKQATDQLEATWRAKGEMLTAAPDGGVASMGKMRDSGPEYDRARRVVDRVLPPYLPKDAVRVYVVDNKEWNAMAMGNYSIYVFTGIMGDLDDDELALVIGHEIAHASHEHTRKQQKRGLLTGLLAVSAGGGGAGDARERRGDGGGHPHRPRRGRVRQRLLARAGGPGRSRRHALRLRGRLRREQGTAAVEALRRQVRRARQDPEHPVRRSLAIERARGGARPGDRAQLRGQVTRIIASQTADSHVSGGPGCPIAACS